MTTETLINIIHYFALVGVWYFSALFLTNLWMLVRFLVGWDKSATFKLGFGALAALCYIVYHFTHLP